LASCTAEGDNASAVELLVFAMELFPIEGEASDGDSAVDGEGAGERPDPPFASSSMDGDTLREKGAGAMRGW
jgi:hypothetical protein